MDDRCLADVPSLCLVGAGKMGGAMLQGWLANGLAPSAVTVLDPGLSDDNASEWKDLGVSVNPTSPVRTAKVIVLAVKPQIMGTVLEHTQKNFSFDAESLVVSVAAGWTIANFEAVLGEHVPIVRVMPNTPSAIGEGMLVGCANGLVAEQDKAIADSLMLSVGETAWIDDEALMDAVTAVSGSGPAYVFYLAECLAAAGRDAGLPDDLAAKLAEATVSGAGALIKASDDNPSELRINVTSPNGTTAAALDVLMADDGLGPLMRATVSAAARRSRELAQ